MVTKIHREYDVSNMKNRFFIVGRTKEQVMSELEEFAKATTDKVFYNMLHVRPAKGIPVPEYSMEVLSMPENESPGLLFIGWTRFLINKKEH